ncbi:MAG: hypothetical protein QOG23_1433 [Blastocatellia bacterium]|jgi:hypothetical protein|nr:hypothetical protein [Blastocatellia bacterium]
MSRKWLLFLFCLSIVLLVFGPLARARGVITINEGAIRFLIQHDSASVLLSINNSCGELVRTRIQIEVLDPENRVKASIDRVEDLARGTKILTLPVPFNSSKLLPAERHRLLWYRLHYRVIPDQSAANTTDGLVSLSEITPDLFEVRLATSEIVHEGGGYFARIQTIHPITRRPAANVAIDAEVTLEDDNDRSVKLKAAGVTDSHGYVVLNFRLPARFPSYPHTSQPDGGEIHVIASRNGLVAELSADVLVDQFARFLISTDKPLYQPGQVLHVRALSVTPSKHALANQDIRIRIDDPEQTNIFRTVVKSSRFGITSVDWTIPDNARLGDYRIWVGVDGGEESSEMAYDFRISRYDLPNFSVTIQPDHKYYLPNQNAIVKVRADYLFGQSVKRGHVRVVRENEREWNYAEQKWDIDEGDVYEGETDADGTFVARIKLADDHKELTDNEYRRFKDISYAAYFTDATTNRTEQRRFDLRITKEAIHVYVIGPDYDDSRNRNLPLTFYLSTFYADGSPAQCTVNVSLARSTKGPLKRRDFPFVTVRSNRYGLAKVSGHHLPVDLKDSDELDLSATASDSRGQTGSKVEQLSLDEDDAVLVETEKSIYRTDEPITALITSSARDLTVVVDLVSDQSVIRSERLRLHDGRGSITFPYRSDLKDVLTIAAYQDFTDSRRMIATRSVLYPRSRDLKVNVGSIAASYRPGQEARVDLSVRAHDGSPTAGALGVVVFDKAVEERTRTDLEFGHRVSTSSETLQHFLGLDNQISGISLGDLRSVDTSKPVPADLDLAAEVLLNQSRDYAPQFHEAEQYETDQVKVFGDLIRSNLKSLHEALTARYLRTSDYPHDEGELRRLLIESGIDFAALRDPWGSPYRPVFSVDKQSDVLTLMSSGPDKHFDTADDFSVERSGWAYFRPVGEAIDRAVRRYHEHGGGFIRDSGTLRSEVAKEGINLDTVRDRWGRPYRFDFDIDKIDFVINVRSSGPDKEFEKADQNYSGDDFTIWTSSIDYFAEVRARLDSTLTQQLKDTNRFPQSHRDLREALRTSGLAFESLRDPWSHPYYAVFKVQPFYADLVKIESRARFGDPPVQRTQLIPVTETATVINVRSTGPDGKMGTPDDFDVATFAGVLSEQAGNDPKPRLVGSPVVVSGASGAITGAVTDPNGAMVAGAHITATNSSDATTHSTITNEDGKYGFGNLLPGLYEVRFEAYGFTTAVITDVLVRASNIVEVNVSLQVGTATQTVTVTGGGPSLQTSVSNSSMADLLVSRKLLSLPRGSVNIVTKSGSSQSSTPHLRNYFPETLVWQPSLETDKQGRAQLKFKLADNITTWKMSVIASTEDGQIGTVEKEIKAFQPFFVEHDPPRILTEGDEISLPVVVRNYLDHPQAVNLEIKSEPWFALLGPATKSVNVAAGDATRESFDFRAIATVKDGKQRITAAGTAASDAIEKPITAHPDGEEKSVTASDIVSDSGVLALNLPASLIPNSARAQLKIYPNLMAHIAESVEAIMERPYGCGEQTISSTYPSLLLLRNYKKSGQDSPLRRTAERYLHAGYDRLLNYRDSSGGFTYWGRGEPDLALTAYALRFLSEAREFIAVDDDVINQAREWVIKQQRSDGSWAAYDYGDKLENKRRTALLTAYVARVLAMTERKDEGKPSAKPAALSPNASSLALKRALERLALQAEEIDEPYLLASYALAALGAGDPERAEKAIYKLRSLAHEENGASFWSLETNTPFYGWGLAGRVETTALVVQALAHYESGSGLSSNRSSATSGAKFFRHKDKLINQGLLFLLREKDRYGVWYSTQATITVLDAMVVLLAGEGDLARSLTTPPLAEILVNGRRVKSLELPAPGLLVTPITVNLDDFVQSGNNRIEIRRAGESSPASAQAVATYYLPWAESIATQNDNWRANGSSGLRLVTRFDRTEANISDRITCHVEAERIGFSRYGMMLAEIGLPPGADVDRASLDAAMKGSDWSISQYDVLPDRVIVYLWPRAGGTKFDFTFRPRFGLRAKTAASLVYDYYNPEARASVAPINFVVN